MSSILKTLALFVLCAACSIAFGNQPEGTSEYDKPTSDADGSLFEAAIAGHHDEVERLLAAQEAVDQTDDKEETALILAAANGHAGIVGLLLAYNADPDLQQFQGATALMAASFNGHPDIVELLLAANAEIDIAANDGKTALSVAAEYDHADVVRTLLRGGADPGLPNIAGNQPLHFARTEEVGRLLLDAGARINARNADGNTPLIYAAANGEYSLVMLLLERGAQIDAQGKYDGTALMSAAQKGRTEVVRALIAQGADMSLKAENGFPASKFAKTEEIRAIISGQEYEPLDYNDGEEALKKADFDKAKKVFRELGAAGNEDAKAAAALIDSLSEDDRTEWVLNQGAEAVRVGDLNEAERLFTIAIERGNQLAPQLLEIVLQTKKELAPIDVELDKLKSQLQLQCRTTLKMEGTEVVAFEDCPEGAPQALVDKHRQQVRVAIQNAEENGFSEAASTIVTESGTSGSVIWGQEQGETSGQRNQ